MESPHLWVGLVLVAVVAQTVRNFAQRSIGKLANPWAATLVRFLYGLPFTILAMATLVKFMGPLPPLAAFGVAYWIWIGLATAAQLLATAWLLMSMAKSSFVIAVALSKTELAQIVIFSMLALQQDTTVLVLIAICIVSFGVLVLATAGRHRTDMAGLSRAALLGVSSGTAFALAALGFREAGLAFLANSSVHVSSFYVGVWNLLLAQLAQSVLLGGWLAWRERSSLAAILNLWRSSLGAGFIGALASMAWFTAYVLRPAADVRTLGMLEIVLSYFVSRRLLHEGITWREVFAILLICTGVALTALQG